MNYFRLILLITFAAGPFVVSALGDDVDFARDVLPILSDKCFVCHGPDAEEDLVRLDSDAAAVADLGGYQAINHDQPEQSEVLKRILSTDDPMPPEDAEKQLTDAERDTIERWIRDGGKYAQHWAFVAPKLRADHDGDSSEQIDQYIRDQLTGKGIDFAALADKATLARRVSLVLTGLPPDLKQLDQFLADDSPEAYAHFVDALMSQPSFGEHQARYWLDAVRYGDTHGLHLDNRRGIYPYRDWVVSALNNNLPLDDFIAWQVAGDLLPDPTLGQRVATGFVRLNPSTGEGGAIGAEFQAKNNFDRVENVGTVFLGMSLTCARCHNHKYDPITQKEYYQLMAYFNNTAEPALDGNSYTYGPTERVPDSQQDWRRWSELEMRREGILAAVGKELEDAELLAKTIDYAKKRSNWKTSAWRICKPIAADAAIPQPNTVAPKDEKPAAKKAREKKQAWSAAGGLPGAISGRAARGKLPTAGKAVWVTFNITAAEDQQVTLSFSGAGGSQAYLDDDDQPIVTKAGDQRAEISLLKLTKGDHKVRLKILGAASTPEIQVNATHAWDALAKTKNWSAVSKGERLRMLSDPSGPLAGSRQSRSAGDVASQIRELESNFTTTLVAKELSKPRETKLLRRGEYHMPEGDPLAPGVFAALNPLPKDASPNRAGLAVWLTSADNPLVARVLVNRIWQRTFGYGLVRTPEDFGLQGQQPTHPELLDWLAIEMHRSGWNLKHMLRLMVTSQTFRQSSAWRKDVDDPENRLFSRGPSFRLDAEMLRDTGLWASGLLDPHMGGEGVKPYQPGGMWIAMAHPASNTKQYQADKGKRLYRRSLYVYWKRTSPHPMMTLFDAPDRESSCVRRSRTTTALQSLAMLNETQRVEIGRKLAERLLRERDNDDARLELLFRLLTSRKPSTTERLACQRLLDAMRGRYRSSADDAKQLLAVGEAGRDESQDATEQAAWTHVTTTVLASDVAILLY